MSILQQLLNAGLVDIGSDDSRFEKMQSAATALATKFGQEPHLVIPATLISLDDSVDERDAMFALVEELVIGEWKTLRNTHVNRPRELLRSIVIDALSAGTTSNVNAAGAVWNTAASLLRHGQARMGKAAPLIEKVILTAGDVAESEAVKRAGLVAEDVKSDTSKQVQPEKISLKIQGAIKDAELLKDIARAAGPQFPPTPTLESPNPHWANAGQPWSTEFVPRMAAALANAVNLGTSRLAESLGQNITDYLHAFDKQLADKLHEVAHLQREMWETHESSRMRLDVLWWSEALYSPSLRVGYRDLSLPVASAAAAFDLAAIVPPLAPASVCYVLGETVLRIARILGADAKQPLISYLQCIAEKKINFGDGILSVPSSNARVPLVDIVREASVGSQIIPEMLHSRAGIDGSLTVSSAEFAMWVFRGLQANRLVEVR